MSHLVSSFFCLFLRLFFFLSLWVAAKQPLLARFAKLYRKVSVPLIGCSKSEIEMQNEEKGRIEETTVRKSEGDLFQPGSISFFQPGEAQAIKTVLNSSEIHDSRVVSTELCLLIFHVFAYGQWNDLFQKLRNSNWIFTCLILSVDPFAASFGFSLLL